MRTVKSEALRCVQQQDAAPADRKRLYPLERRFVPTPERSGTETNSRGRAPYFYFSFLSHSARRCLFTRRFLLTSAGKTLEPPPSLQIVLNQFPLLLLFRPNRTQACFLTGDSEVIKKNKTQHNTSKKTTTRLTVEVVRLPA